MWSQHKVTELTSEAEQKGASPQEGSDHEDDPALMSLKVQFASLSLYKK
jgi:hypothetical protein